MSHAIRRALRRAAAPAAALLFLATPALAQGTLMGSVVADSGGKAVGGAVIRIPSLSRGARTNWTGDFVIDGLAAGTYEAVAQAPGFAPLTIEVTIPANGSISQTFRLKHGDAAAPAVVAGAAGAPGAARDSSTVTMSARMAAFERRRSEGRGAYLTRADLARVASGRLIDAVRPILRGAIFKQMENGTTKLVSTRDLGAGSLSNAGGQKQYCFVQVFVDGTAVGGTASSTGTPSLAQQSGHGMQAGALTLQGDDLGLDFTPLSTGVYDAVEFYSDPASTPPEYRRSGARCGTILLWSRE